MSDIEMKCMPIALKIGLVCSESCVLEWEQGIG